MHPKGESYSGTGSVLREKEFWKGKVLFRKIHKYYQDLKLREFYAVPAFLDQFYRLNLCL